MKNLIKIFLIVTLIIFTKEILIGLISEKLPLSWPGKGLISPIFELKGFYLNDFFTNAILNTPQRNSANIFYFILPNNQNNILSIFSILTSLCKSLICSLTFLILTISALLINDQGKKETILDRFFKEKFYMIFIFLALAYNILDFASVIFSYLKYDILSEINSLIINLLFGSTIADWGFPSIDYSISSRGIALIISLIGLLIPFYFQLYSISISTKKSKILLFIYYLINFISVLIHPVSPLFSITILLSLKLFIKNKIPKFNYKKFLTINLLIYLSGITILLIQFPQDLINNIDFFDIYVKFRHPHHYLTSYYLNSFRDENKILYFSLLGNIISVFCIVNIAKIKKLNNKNISLSFILSIGFLVSINLIQYFSVELFKINSLIKFGVSSLNPLFNFYFLLGIILFALKYLEIYNSELVFFNFTKNYRNFINSNIINILFYFILTTSTAFVIYTFNINLNKINNSYSRILSTEFNQLKINTTSEFIIDDSLNNQIRHPREIGLLNIFADSYFPFETNSINKWKDRINTKSVLNKCLKSNLLSCEIPFRFENEIYFISDKEINQLKNKILEKDIRGKKFFIYQLPKSKD